MNFSYWFQLILMVEGLIVATFVMLYTVSLICSIFWRVYQEIRKGDRE